MFGTIAVIVIVTIGIISIPYTPRTMSMIQESFHPKAPKLGRVVIAWFMTPIRIVEEWADSITDLGARMNGEGDQ